MDTDRWRGAVARRAKAALLAVLACVLTACRPSDSTSEGPWFEDVASATGLAFTHHSDRSDEFYYPEVIGSGVALFDSDNDGDLDVFLVQGSPAAGPSFEAKELRSRLFRNDLEGGASGGRLRFVDVTDVSGLSPIGHGMGVAAGDYNNDGCTDLYVTSLERNWLMRNDCRGAFVDVSAESGTQDQGWSVSAAFVDFDRDGWLDLFVGHYLTWTPALNTPCYGSSGERVYCSPKVYRAQQSRLYRNNRDGTFADVTSAAGLATQFGPALGVSTADFDGDGWPDLYVANDGEENQLWINQRNGAFVNRALLAGVALGPSGEAKAGMGVDAADFDEDGDEDLVVTNLTGEGMDLYVNDGRATFVNSGAGSGIGHRSLPYTGFGVGWLDVDNDGRLDLLAVNGAVQVQDRPASSERSRDLGQRPQLFRNLGNGRFDDVTAAGGPPLSATNTSRGAAFGDIDNDGDTDVVVNNNLGRAQLLLSTVGQRQHWVGVRVVGAHRSDSLGARVAITPASGPPRWRRARADGSYASASDPRVLVGLGTLSGPARARVTWPNGRVEEWQNVAIDRYTTLTEGTGQRR
jgi:enediyne biosynthesis protein E4